MRWLEGITDSEDKGLRCAAVHGIAESDTTEWLNNNNMESRKKKELMNLVKKGLVDTVEEGKGGMNLKNSTDIYTLSCIKQWEADK